MTTERPEFLSSTAWSPGSDLRLVKIPTMQIRYVCFRRRELRQTRKHEIATHQSAEKPSVRLRKELEDARNILQMVKQRENVQERAIQTDRRSSSNDAKSREQRGNWKSKAMTKIRQSEGATRLLRKSSH